MLKHQSCFCFLFSLFMMEPASSGLEEYFAGCGIDQEKLSAYCQLLQQNEIGLEDLPDFDHELLSSIGITNAKHRLLMLKWIKEKSKTKSKAKGKSPQKKSDMKKAKDKSTIASSSKACTPSSSSSQAQVFYIHLPPSV